jgi:hypothetical protein
MSWRTRALLLTGVLAAALPALGQDRSPESLLPPGFNDPQNLPPPEEKAAPQKARPQLPTAPTLTGNETDNQLAGNQMGDVQEVALDQSALPRPTNYFSIPEGAARPVDVVGPLAPGNFGLGEEAFGSRNGPLYAALMRRLDAPLPSRWTSILLRRGHIDPRVRLVSGRECALAATSCHQKSSRDTG